MARKINHAEFNSLLSTFPNNVVKRWKDQLQKLTEGKFSLSSGSYVEFIKPNKVTLGLSNKRHRIVTQQFKSNNAVQLCFNSNWFEVKVGKLLSGWKRAKAIYHNCIFPFNKDLDKNEVDLIVDTGSKLLFVECKTQITQTTDIDKFRTIIRNYGGQGSKGLFVIVAKFSEMALKKCSESEILTFSLFDSNLNMEPSEALYLLLESELFNINSK